MMSRIAFIARLDRIVTVSSWEDYGQNAECAITVLSGRHEPVAGIGIRATNKSTTEKDNAFFHTSQILPGVASVLRRRI
jgi:hypothetical protein